MDQPEFSGETHWSRTFRNHVLGLEQFLADNVKPRFRDRLPGEQIIYLAGMIAREMDRAYLAQIQDYLVEDPHEMDQAVRRHAPYLGQNAPLVTLSRINAEHATLQIATTGSAAGDVSQVFLLTLPARYFGIASFYSSQAGNQTLARIFDFFRNHLAVVVEILAGYIENLDEKDWDLDVDPEQLAQSTAWKKFAAETNEVNKRKDFWEAARLNPAKKNRISGIEFREMIDYTSPN